MSFAAEHVSIAGLVIAALFAAYGVIRYRGGGSRLDLLLSLLIAAGVALVSVVPQVGGIFTAFSGWRTAASRCSPSPSVLFGLFLNLLGRVRAAGRRSGEIVTGLAVREYSEEIPLARGEGRGTPWRGADSRARLRRGGRHPGGLRRIPDEVLGHEVKTVVVDDGSTDATAAIARAEGVPVVSHVVNRGQGDALEGGLRDSAGRKGSGRRQPRR